jgi:hypothetical protein
MKCFYDVSLNAELGQKGNAGAYFLGCAQRLPQGPGKATQLITRIIIEM